MLGGVWGAPSPGLGAFRYRGGPHQAVLIEGSGAELLVEPGVERQLLVREVLGGPRGPELLLQQLQLPLAPPGQLGGVSIKATPDPQPGSGGTPLLPLWGDLGIMRTPPHCRHGDPSIATMGTPLLPLWGDLGIVGTPVLLP